MGVVGVRSEALSVGLRRRAARSCGAALFEAIDDAVFVHDAQGNILEANPAACRRLGYTREELIGLNTRDIDDPSFGCGFEERLEAQLRNEHFRCEGRHRTKDGRILHVDINTSLIQMRGKPGGTGGDARHHAHQGDGVGAARLGRALSLPGG